MLKIVGTDESNNVLDEKVLITNDNKPTPLLIGLALLEIACDITLACILAKTIFRR